MQPFNESSFIKRMASGHRRKLLRIDHVNDHAPCLFSRMPFALQSLNRVTGEKSGAAILAHVFHKSMALAIQRLVSCV
jgi:hypothetical protein